MSSRIWCHFFAITCMGSRARNVICFETTCCCFMCVACMRWRVDALRKLLLSSLKFFARKLLHFLHKSAGEAFNRCGFCDVKFWKCRFRRMPKGPRLSWKFVLSCGQIFLSLVVHVCVQFSSRNQIKSAELEKGWCVQIIMHLFFSHFSIYLLWCMYGWTKQVWFTSVA